MKSKLLIIFTLFSLFLASCQSPQKPPVQIFQPPAFSFVTIDPNRTDVEYVERMKRYDSIIAQSEIPVYVMDPNAFHKHFPVSFVTIDIKLSDPNDPNSIEIVEIKRVEYHLLGQFMYGQKKPEWPETFIFINNTLTPEEIITTYAHEIGHYEHKKTECLCMSGMFPIMAEEHAFLNELKLGWQYNDVTIMKTAVGMISNYALGEDRNSLYTIAALNVIKTELFKKTVTYLFILEGITQ